ncbi:hypothetical protein HYH02_000111 [Chlamydomonas schloesseri]|uniref:Uncharacterized protein n=1 Tax=Chlamydomonas schloesseri TaxID=2026947 RepID=A0A836B7J2_9CHLO|nr:hypothetical protein HYH02_000111 [Chlamydomonas schloesseri]|eukprot:KAG2450007.1 hypothetical protein HYH02_000111 [Chlamydomonas schloesseri]
MRHSLFRAARDRGMAFLQAHVDCGLPTALARNQRRTGLAAVPRDALCRMADQFEPPQPERFAWEAASLVVSGEDQGHGEGAHAAQSSSADQSAGEALWSTERVTALVKDLLGLWGPPPPRPPSAAELQRQREEGRAANAASYVHGLDVRSRKALSEAVAAAPDTMRAVVARGLNERRRALLQSARQLLAQAAAAGGTGAGAAAVRDAEAASRAESGEVGENGPPLLQELRWLEEQFMADAGL